jgi:hypothetical protein
LQVQDRFRQLVLGPALVAGHAQMDGELGLAAHHRIGNDHDQGAGLQVEAGAGPERAEDVLDRDLAELLHDGIVIDGGVHAVGEGLAHELAAHGAAGGGAGVFGHRVSSLVGWAACHQRLEHGSIGCRVLVLQAAPRPLGHAPLASRRSR